MATIPFDPATYPALKRGAAGPEAPPTFGAVSSVFGRVGAVLATFGDYTSTLISNLSTVVGTTVSDALDNLQAQVDLAEAALNPFKATFYINPAFTGVSTGSMSNPYKSIAAAFAASAALALTGAIFKIPPNTTVTESVTFPVSGNWEIAADQGFSGSTLGSILTGTVTMNSAAGALRAKITNIVLNGNITGDAAPGFSLSYQATCVRQNGSITLTSSGGVCTAFFRGIGSPDANKFGGSNTLLVSVAGQIKAENWVFEGGFNEAHALTTPYPGSQFQACWFGSTSGSSIPIGLNGPSLNCSFYDCIFVGPTTFTSSVADYTVYLDGASLASLNHPIAGMILIGTRLQYKTINANASSRLTLVNNVGSTAFGGRNADGLYEVVVDETLLVAGTAGALQANVIYTDMTGTLVTVPVGATLNIAGAVGTKASGSLIFRHNGAAAPIAFSYTGVVTPGTMSVAASIVLMCRT